MFSGTVCALYQSMARKPRIIQNEFPYHLFCRTNNRTFRFNQRQITRIVFNAVTEAALKYRVKVHHIVLMSNHYHIIAATTEENVHRFMQYANSKIAVQYNRTVGRTGHLWGGRYKSCIVSNDEYYLSAVRYIYRNPVRAKMVKDISDYEDSSLQFWAFGRDMNVYLTDDHLVLYMGANRQKVAWFLLNLVMDEGETFPSDSYMNAALSKMFYGPDHFVKYMNDTYVN